ncbi:MAG: hydantoinase B/oxoprolinase family protein [Candidatus Obscuribacterales bacterium]|nr:hydantoinase B/oxoprolinase family protein [Candidatus Obscuribacterales bacterium]
MTVDSRQHATWQFFIDRGGTFTDIVAICSNGAFRIRKLLSTAQHYEDAAIEGILAVLNEAHSSKASIREVRLGTTVATNALLERRGAPTVAVVNRGFKDALRIGYQNRPEIFARRIRLPEPLYSLIIEVPGRFAADGEEIEPFDHDLTLCRLQEAFDQGMTACAIFFMHSYLFPQHEKKCQELARKIGFGTVSMSHELSPLIRLIERGDTTVADAYLSPILQKYLSTFTNSLDRSSTYFMQSNGGLTDQSHFRAKDSLLSGPAGGVVGAVETARALGFNKVIGFDMGGTSTDVSHFEGQFESQELTTISGIRIRAPMLAVHTIAAGGGSILEFDGQRFLVGPESAGSSPGPACYRQGGPLTITDVNLLLGRLQPDYFPKVFGPNNDEGLDVEVVQEKFTTLTKAIATANTNKTLEETAWGFLEIAIEKMAAAIRKITVERGYDISEAVLNCFGGAGGQHACLIAERLGINTVMVHPLAGVLSALGIGLAGIKRIEHHPVQRALCELSADQLEEMMSALEVQAVKRLEEQAPESAEINLSRLVLLRYSGSDTNISVPLQSKEEMTQRFNELHLKRFGFHDQVRPLIVESLTLEAQAAPTRALEVLKLEADDQCDSGYCAKTARMYNHHMKWHDAQLFHRDSLSERATVKGPAIVIDPTSTTVIEPGWQASISLNRVLVLQRDPTTLTLRPIVAQSKESTPDPIALELFNSKFMSIAEEMGVTLRKTSQSVNIKERLDFSCAIFDGEGRLIANAPHMPVHLGSMGASVQAVMAACSDIRNGDVYVLNNPYTGGTHLPDITVVTPIFGNDDRQNPLFYAASRGHHADVGGITPGSMPPSSRNILEEGALIDPTLLVRDGRLLEENLRALLIDGPYPARNIDQNLADLKAQVAANKRGVLSLTELIDDYGFSTVNSYMRFVRHNAEECVRRAIDKLANGYFELEMDTGAKICVRLSVDKTTRSATIDFTGSSPQLEGNLNAPRAVTIAAVLYVFRTLVDNNIPLNDGCMAPLEIIIPEGSMLSPSYPAAVVAGNVETSQAVVDAVYGALNKLAASAGTMSNFTFGDDRHQYYETICGGAGAGPEFHGASAVQTHMTNSRLTDPEVLEWRFPVILKEFAIRAESGGIGTYNGGNGVVRKLQFKEAMQASILSERRCVKPFGMMGGGDGKCGNNYVVRQAESEVVQLGGTATVEMKVDDIFVIETPGGGGWGKP